MRLHELAKEIGAESKALLKLAKELGLRVKNHSSNLAVGEIAILKAAHREEFGDTATEEAAEEAEKPAPKKKRRTRRRGAAAAPAEPMEAEAEAVAVEDEPVEAPESETFEQVEESVQVEEPELVTEQETLEPVMVSEEVDRAHEAEAAPTADEIEPAAEATPAEEPVAVEDVDHTDETEPAEETQPVTPETVEEPVAETVASPDAPTSIEIPASGPSTATVAPETIPVDSSVIPPGEELRPAAEKAATARQKEPAKRKLARPTTTGKVPQTPTPRRRAPGAKIVGRIELPPEEINKPRGPRPATATPTGPTAGGAHYDEPSTTPVGRAGHAAGPLTRDTGDRRKGAARPKEESSSWSPDDEDDPLLQGIRIQNVQRGPHTRRPPRRVGPRRSARKVPLQVPSGPVDVQVPITVRDLSGVLGVKANRILKLLLERGVMAHANLALDEEGVLEVATGLNRETNISSAKDKEEVFLEQVDALNKKLAEQTSDDESTLPLRPPVVAFLGHVDHGKTSLLDHIRSTNVAAGEAGGITQSMRAYSVSAPSGGTITFLDTPGHKAFTEMRARGAHVTDIVVLVVAADDGVMPQTEEAVQHARAAGTPIVVAMNKMDKVEANPDRVLQQLATVEVMVEGWGGEVQVARVSAITGQGIDDLLEKITLQAEIMDLRADADRQARGTVIESRKDEQLGAVATMLVQEGTLRQGDVVLSGTAFGRVRTLVNDQGTKVEEVGPSTPVNLIGLNEAPSASEAFYVVESLKKAREVALERDQKARLERVAGPAPAGAITLENLFANLEAGKTEEIKVVLRCDVQGSLEVVRRSLEELETKEVKVKLIGGGLGAITEADVLLGLASEALVIGFNIIADEKARSMADDKGVDIRTYQVIYELIDEMKAAMEGVLSPIQREQIVGHVEVREVFKVSRLGSIAGCKVQDGIVKRSSKIRLSREGRVIYDGTLNSLKRFKDDVREVKEGLECGLRIDGYDDIKVGDILEVIEHQEEKRTLDFANS